VVNLHERLRELRTKFGYTQNQIAKLLNIDRSTYAYYETGKTRPDVATLLVLSQIYNLSISELLADESVPKYVADRGYVSDYIRGKKNSSHIYNLTTPEKDLVGAFRICSPEEQKHITDYVFRILRNHPPIIK
jgi:transcriptional regulator with XRE-family HTH domain